MRATDRRSHRYAVWCALVGTVVAAGFLVLPALSGVPARLIEGCGGWIAAAVALEMLSVLGFVVVFKLVFAASVSWRRSIPAGLWALAASTALPAGGLIGPSTGAVATRSGNRTLPQLARSTVAFVLLTNVPGMIVLATLGTLLWLGLPGGPDQAALTLLPGAIAFGLLLAAWFPGQFRRRRPARSWLSAPRLITAARTLSDGVAEARVLVRAGNWKLLGALAYYAFDNAVLWAAFHAYGHTPPLGVLTMGYLVGSLAGALPLPAGLGAVDGGLIGALVLYGAPPAPAAAAVLLYRGISLSLPLALGAVTWGLRLAEGLSPESVIRGNRGLRRTVVDRS
jgi:uncharacterized membrane protein YbhN (UPF0104 family)